MVTWFVVPSYVFVIVTGTFGNLVVLYAYLTGERVWNRPYNLILSHGVVADLIICAFFTPLLLLYRSNAPARVIESSPLCELSVFSSMLAISLQYELYNYGDLKTAQKNPYFLCKKFTKIPFQKFPQIPCIKFPKIPSQKFPQIPCIKFLP